MNRAKRTGAACLVGLGLLAGVCRGAADDLARDFRNPPETTKPWCY